jgi:rhamnose utilization protein RhaD (predicted bifunctional aldolase and dehydrogenase)
MSNAESVLQALVEMSRSLGRPERDLVILGEGNTSALCDDGTFWVKASGTELRTIDAQGFVRVRLGEVCALAEREGLTDEEIKAALEAAKVDPLAPRRPSVETVLHALALAEAGAKFVGHTHPVAVNALACSVGLTAAISGRLFPDEIVVCGPAPAYVPYTDPGLPLARAVRQAFRRYAERWGEPPKVVLMQNHGLIALGSSPQQVDQITEMYVKTCRILAGTYAFGGPHFMTPEQVRRIHTRPDELYRRKQLGIV